MASFPLLALIFFCACAALPSVTGAPKASPATEDSGANARSLHEAKGEAIHEEGQAVHEEVEGVMEGEGEGEEEGGEEEEEEFTPVDVNAACMLLGGVTFVMALFSLVNVDDDDVRRYAWKVISNTISIFMAVLFFQGNNEVLMTAAAHIQLGELSKIVISFVHCLIYLAALLLTIGFISGVWGEPVRADLDEEAWTIADAMLVSFETQVPSKDVRAVSRGDSNATKSVITDEYNLEVAVVRKPVEYERRKRNNRCWSTLMAHMGGFAAIAAGGSMQQSKLFSSGPIMCMIPVVITTGVLLLCFQFTNVMRNSLKAEARKSGRAGRRAQMVNEFVGEAENEILSLAISFLTVQAVRFAITGQLPNGEGLEEPMEFTLTWTPIFILWGSGICFVCASIVLARASQLLAKSEEEMEAARGEEETETLGERMSEVLMSSCANAFAWCILWGARWAWMKDPVGGIPVTSIDGRIILALMLSMFGFVAIRALDQVDDMLRADSAPTKTAERVVASIIGSVSVLVGFTWEHSFDGAVTAVADLNKDYPQLTKFLLGLTVFSVLLRPWRRYILRRAIQLEELKACRDEAVKKAISARRASQRQELASNIHASAQDNKKEDGKPLLYNCTHCG